MKARRIVALLVATVTMMVPVLQASPASAATSGEFVSSINSLRSSKGLGTLSVNGSLSSVAQNWAGKMAAAGKISHNPNLGSVSGNWTKLGENVGVGSDVAGLMRAFQNSPSHMRNLVDPAFNSVGVGVVKGADGRTYTAHVFATFPGASAPKPSAPKPTAAPKPAAPKPTVTPKPAAAPVQNIAATKPAPAPAAATPQAAPAAPDVPAAPVAPPAPAPSPRIVQGYVELAAISTQG